MLKSKMRSENSQTIIAEINVAPLVDVCLVLVIIFMVTTTAFLEPPFDIALPEAHTAEQTKEENIFVAVSPEGFLAVNESQIEKKDFPDFIRKKIQKSRHKLIIIRADENADSGAVIDVMTVVKKAGARRITFGTEEIVE
ncbi:biopolymer transporter ExbD [bacterium]|nr:biopolymer transporter ExbD [bacterium]